MVSKPVGDRPDPLGDLWTCPKCGRRLSRNLWHSCTAATVDAFLRTADAQGRRLYARFERMIAACGPYHVSPAKTRIAFMARVRFAGVTKVRGGVLHCSFAMPRPLRSPRFVKVEEVAPGWWTHRLQVRTLAELDDELQGWLRASYRLMGMQERLRRRSAGAAGRKTAKPASRKRGPPHR